jgi:NAD(P)-dependent dehydrogenase (short-subunit alcohol dehydrogenase family)
VSEFASVERLANVAFDDVGGVRLLVNNAGVEQVSLLWEAPVTAWHRLMGVNLTGVYHGIRAFVPRLIDAGHPATVINTASVASFTSGAYQGMYQVSKRAVLALSESLAADLEAVNAPIQVSVAFPSAVDTAIFQHATEDGGQDTVQVLQSLRDLLADHGMDPDTAGAAILEAACSGQRWISTHPDDAAVFATMAVGHLHDIASELKDADA